MPADNITGAVCLLQLCKNYGIRCRSHYFPNLTQQHRILQYSWLFKSSSSQTRTNLIFFAFKLAPLMSFLAASLKVFCVFISRTVSDAASISVDGHLNKWLNYTLYLSDVWYVMNVSTFSDSLDLNSEITTKLGWSYYSVSCWEIKQRHLLFCLQKFYIFFCPETSFCLRQKMHSPKHHTWKYLKCLQLITMFVYVCIYFFKLHESLIASLICSVVFILYFSIIVMFSYWLINQLW